MNTRIEIWLYGRVSQSAGQKLLLFSVVVIVCLQPYHPEHAWSGPISEAKQGWTVLVFGWENNTRCCFGSKVAGG